MVAPPLNPSHSSASTPLILRLAPTSCFAGPALASLRQLSSAASHSNDLQPVKKRKSTCLTPNHHPSALDSVVFPAPYPTVLFCFPPCFHKYKSHTSCTSWTCASKPAQPDGHGATYDDTANSAACCEILQPPPGPYNTASTPSSRWYGCAVIINNRYMPSAQPSAIGCSYWGRPS